MNKNPRDPLDPLRVLRQQAEERLRGQIVDDGQLAKMEPDAIRHLVHELQTHQIELEMQNETLRQTQEALVSARDQFVELYDFSPVGYFTIAEKGRIAGANLTGCALFNVERNELLGHNFTEFIVEQDQDRYYLHSKEVLASTERQACELRIKRADGTTFYSHIDSQSVAADTSSFRLAISDISANKEMEHKLIHLERLRAIGELAAGVSHNLNNMLTGVLIPAQILRERNLIPDLSIPIDDIITSGRRMADLVRQVHHYAHQDEPSPLEAVDLNAAVGNAVELSRSRWQDQTRERGLEVNVITRLGKILPIQGANSELESLLLNLLLNAVDALSAGGTITLQTSLVEGETQLTISDTGIGMDTETQRRVFEPFFTTKAAVGTGLGLSTAYATMQHWGGHINVQSELGVGTTFTLRFPVYNQHISLLSTLEAPALATAASRILVVDDSELIIDVFDRLLSEKHQVEFARDGIEALSTFAKNHYDVVLIDLGLPKLTGDQVAQAMRQIDSAVALGLITGWKLKVDDERLALFDFHMQKPFGDLDAITDILDRAIALCQQRKKRHKTR